jgi:hypothetical protein
LKVLWGDTPQTAKTAENTEKTAGKVGSGNVGGSNPLNAFFKRSTGFDDQGSRSATADTESVSETPEATLAFYLALLRRKAPDLALVLERGDALPEAVRTGILAMVEATKRPGRLELLAGVRSEVGRPQECPIDDSWGRPVEPC